VGFQKILTLTYVDKLIDDVHKEFRDKYRNQFQQKGTLGLLNGTFDFKDDFLRLLRDAEESSKVRAPTVMKTFEQSVKSQKTVKCMIETRGEKPKEKVKNKKNKGSKKEGTEAVAAPGKASAGDKQPSAAGDREELTKDEILQKNREEFFKRHMKAGEKSRWVTRARSLYSSFKPALPGVPQPQQMFHNSPPLLLCSTKKGGLGGMFGMLKGLVGSKSLTRADMDPVLEKMKDHLIAKNVAAEIAVQLCESVAKKLEGKVMGTFTTVTSTVKQALQEALVQILQPQRRVDVLRDVMDAQRHRRPYVVTFCGVNGVGKSTNLAKISFWLIENGFSVLIAACDTFRAGAVEQLRTHTRRLNALHPPESHGGRTMVQLYEKGYGKDAAGIAMEAISYGRWKTGGGTCFFREESCLRCLLAYPARNQGFDVVLVDTAGRMQDNAPLMTALAKLIAVNAPDLVLFVGEALVGNEAVDQLVKFNKALADHSMAQTPRLIDGIVLTKFDTIDDKVGAAISMTYITSKPIVFVGTGQTYCDLRSLNAKAVVTALMKA
ncbi:SRPRA protein, partial [Corythaeola cristata]|nr:SRPRA protein [Corythaeola cristata]